MCGIVGIYLKNPELRPRLGEIFSPMLMEMGERGPDSSGVVVYREDDAARSGKVIAYDPEAGLDWDGVAAPAAASRGTDRSFSTKATASTSRTSRATSTSTAAPNAASRACTCASGCESRETSG